MASAAPCDSTAQESLAVTPSTSLDLSSVFACEDGAFEVQWSGTVSITETIRIGRGTTVAIIGGGSDISGGTSDGETAEVNQFAAIAAVNAFGPIFVANGSVLHLEGIAIRYGNATDSVGEGLVNGGGVHALDADVTVVGCVFEANFALHSGGGIYAKRSRLVVRDTAFRQSSAGLKTKAGDDDVEAEGGGVMVEFSNAFIESCSFEDCYANWRGGALHHGFGNMSVSSSIFSNNSVGSDNVKDESEVGEGGALSLSVCYWGFEGVGSCSVNDSTFFGNTAARKGGSVQLGDGSGQSFIEFNRCSMQSNSAGKNVDNDPQGDGGAIVVGSDITLMLADSSFHGNYAGSKAGAIRISGGNGSWKEPGGNLFLRNCTFDANLADQEQGGVIYLSEYSAVTVEGDDNTFTNNYSGDSGGVMGTTSNARITVQGGNFSGNIGDEYAGVFYAKGNVTITGGLFSNNKGDIRGGVFDAANGAFINITGGVFEENMAGNHGGVGFVASGSSIMIEGGNFSGNVAEIGGGAFYVEEETDFSVTGGNFTGNAADFGGFLYKHGAGLTTCSGASIVNHDGVDGGAMYVVDEAEVEWGCDLGMSHALTGSAIYVRGASNVTLRGITLHDNALPRGSVVFVVASYLRTIEVLFNESAASPDQSAVQIDSDSTFVAEYTSFAGFVGDALIFSEGDVFLDSCDFSGSSAAVLLYAEGFSATSTVRNAVLGENNYGALRQAASDAVKIPTGNSLTNANLTCGGVGEGEAMSPPCSEGTLCLEGDVGVYCQCYVRESTGNETCVSDNSDGLTLVVLSPPETTYFPNLLEGELLLSHSGLPADNSSIDVDSSSAWTDGIIWKASGLSLDAESLMTWTILPSAGVLLPGESVTLGVISAPSSEYDGATTVTFRVDWTDASADSSRRKLASAAVTSMDVIFYHCDAGNFWNISSDAEDPSEGCKSCAEEADGDIEGLDCDAPGVSTRTLPLSDGYWRASLTTIIIRECWNQDACVGGTVVSSVDDYCAGGYEGPYCAVCSSEYGRGTANTCHACTTSFTSGMYFLLVVVTLVSLMILAILVAYLIGGQGTVTNMLRKIKITLQRCSCHCDRLESKREPHPTSGVADRDSMTLVSASTLIETCGKGNSNRTAGAIVHRVETKADINIDKDGTVEEDTVPVAVDLQRDTTREERSGKNRGRDDVGSSTTQHTRANKRTKDVPKCPITGLRSRIPLSKLKIVIVVWQIMSAFAEITQVTLPPIYERFLSVVGIFSFNLTWGLSASCIFTEIDFYDRLLIATIFPFVLLCVLGATFYISSRLPHSVTISNCNIMGGSTSGRPGTDESGTGESVQASATTHTVPTRSFDRAKSRRSFDVRKPGPEGHLDLDQSHKWWLFARHTTMTIIILYLVYTEVSTVVFQTFACQELPEIGKRYLRADFRIECDTAKHFKYQVYAAVMILLYPLGIPAAFCFFLIRQRIHINPTVEKAENVARELLLREKLEKRVKDQSVAPTSFLWGAYFPDRYYYEVCECLRRLLQTGILVFVLPDTAGQVAISCMFAFISLLVFELLRPHVDYLDIQLYRTGCLVIFFSSFLSLTIKAGIADADSNSSAAFAVALVAANVLLFLSIWWNTWVSVGAIFSRDHVQGEVVGFDVLGEDQMNKILGTPADDKDTDKERSYENKGQDDSAVEEKEAPESASSMELSPMPKILDHVWHPKIGYWAPNKDDEIEGAPKSSEFTG